MNREDNRKAWRGAVVLADESDFDLGRITVQPPLCTVLANSIAETVEPRVMQLLVALAQARGTVVARDELIHRCWGGRAISEDAINRCIAKVRKLAELDSGASFTVETIPRVGYRLLERSLETAGALAPETAELAPVKRPEPVEPQPPPHGLFARRWAFAAIGAGTVILSALAYTGYGPIVRGPTGVRVPTPSIARSRAAADMAPPSTTFRDCPDCPEMVAIMPSSAFGMGALDGKPGRELDEGPRHEVWIRHPFAIGKYDVTREEYARFIAEMHRPDGGNCFTLAPTGMFVESRDANWRNPGFPQTPHDPVVCMSWNDAQAYVNWLARRTGKPYRLPSEAEWEFAARGSPFDVGSGATLANSCKRLNGGDADYHARFPSDVYFNGACRDGYSYTSPVGVFPANVFGLFDMGGNVWQWTQDCFHDGYAAAPTDGSAWMERDCALHVVRGGAWTDDSRRTHMTRRGRGDSLERYSSNGFRVARTM